VPQPICVKYPSINEGQRKRVEMSYELTDLPTQLNGRLVHNIVCESTYLPMSNFTSLEILYEPVFRSIFNNLKQILHTQLG
jgi:hypothetical protein